MNLCPSKYGSVKMVLNLLGEKYLVLCHPIPRQYKLLYPKYFYTFKYAHFITIYYLTIIISTNIFYFIIVASTLAGWKSFLILSNGSKLRFLTYIICIGTHLNDKIVRLGLLCSQAVLTRLFMQSIRVQLVYMRLKSNKYKKFTNKICLSL